MDLYEAIYSRRASCAFRTESIEETALRELIDAAIQAPSAFDEQPWSFCLFEAETPKLIDEQRCSFCVIRDKTRLADISRGAKAHMLATTPAGLLSPHFEKILANPNFDIFYGAPALIVISAPAANPRAAESCALAAQNLMLAARGLGLGTCWIGFAQQWLRTAAGQALLDMPAGYAAVAPIVVGHPVTQPIAIERKPPDIRWIGA